MACNGRPGWRLPGWLAQLATGLMLGLLHLAPLHAQAHAPIPEAPQNAGPEALHFTRAEMLSVAATGYALAPLEVRPADVPGAWQSVALPHAPVPALPTLPALAKADAADTVVHWYRLQLPAGMGTESPRYLYLPHWQSHGLLAVYADQHLLYQLDAHQFWNGWNMPLWIPLNTGTGAPAPQTILLRIAHPPEAGGGLSSLWLGDGAQLGWRYHLRYFLQARFPFMCAIAFFMAGVFSLLVWLGKRSETLYLLSFLMACISLLRTLQYLIGDNLLLMDTPWFDWLNTNSLLWLIAVVHFFLNQLHQRGSLALDRGLLACMATIALLTLPPLLPLLPGLPVQALTQYLVLLLGVAAGLVGLQRSRQARSSDGLWLGAWCLMSVLLGLNDWLLQYGYINMEGAYLGPYTNLLAFVLFLHIMVRRYSGAMQAVTQVNASLAQRLQAREAELSLIHAGQREAAQRQTLAAERQRMMQDMHDGMGSSLRTALLAVEKGQLASNLVADVLKDCIDDLKLAIDAMEPVQADLLLLLATLRFRLGPRLEAAGIALRWEVENVPELDWLDPRNALHILRILQEAFTNIIKHTRATEIRVATAVEGDAVLVTLRDNGQGFDVAQGLANPGKGLNNQLRRAQAIGATLAWDTSPAGVCMRLRLPLRRG